MDMQCNNLQRPASICNAQGASVKQSAAAATTPETVRKSPTSWSSHGTVNFTKLYGHSIASGPGPDPLAAAPVASLAVVDDTLRLLDPLLFRSPSPSGVMKSMWPQSDRADELEVLLTFGLGAGRRSKEESLWRPVLWPLGNLGGFIRGLYRAGLPVKDPAAFAFGDAYISLVRASLPAPLLFGLALLAFAAARLALADLSFSCSRSHAGRWSCCSAGEDSTPPS